MTDQNKNVDIILNFSFLAFEITLIVIVIDFESCFALLLRLRCQSKGLSMG